MHQEITALRKSGNIDQAYALAKQVIEKGDQSFGTKNAFSWVIYELIKREGELVKANKKNELATHQHLEKWLREYSRMFSSSEPNLIHSQTLRVTLKLSKQWPGFLAFAKWFGTDRLSENDHVGFKMDNGKTQMSVAEQFYNRVGSHLSEFHARYQDDVIQWAQATLDLGIERFPNSQFLPYDKAKWLLAQGQVEQAESLMIRLVKRLPKVAWTWSLLGCVYRERDNQKAILCFAYATQLAHKEDEIAKVRIELAELLAQAGRYDAAAHQLLRAKSYRETNNYRMPPLLMSLLQSDWFSNIDQQRVMLNSSFGNELTEQAFNVIGLDPNQLKSKHKKSSKTLNDSEVTVLSGQFIQHDGNSFGFIKTSNGQSAFVSGDLIARGSLKNGASCNCKVIPSVDKQGRPSLKAVALVSDPV
jgi:tetratricopeptide (TPR) repeat protein